MKRLQITFFVLLIGLVSFAFFSSTYATHLWYRLTGSHAAFSKLLQSSLANGDSLKKLESVVGVGSRANADDPRTAFRVELRNSRPQEFPDGWRDGDYWVYYSFDNGKVTTWFQVREDRIVNYKPQHYWGGDGPTAAAP